MENSGVVTKRTKGFYYLLTDNGKLVECKVKGLLFKDSRFNNQIAVGDRVSFRLNDTDDVGLITDIKERKSYLSRNRVGVEAEQVIAANVDNLLIVAAAQKPPFRSNLVIRLLVAADIGNIKPTIVITKTDLSSRSSLEEIVSPYKEIGCDIILSSTKTEETDPQLPELFQNKISVLAGQSGVGKSSLLNKLYPDLNIKVGAVSHKTSKGSHTTTYAIMHKIANNSFIIDTPGIREFGLWDISCDTLARHYPRIKQFSYDCKHRNCQHVVEPGCAVQDAVKRNEINEILYKGYLSIHESLKNA